MRALTVTALLTLIACRGGDDYNRATANIAADSAATGAAASYALAPAVAPKRERATQTVEQMQEQAPAPPPAPGQTDVPEPSAVPAMLIRTGEATIEVRNVDSAAAAARRMVEGMGGFVGGMSVEGGKDALRTATLILKMPARRFEQTVAGLAALGTVERQTASTEDVGEEYADLDARIANARRLEARLIDLLARRTGKLEEVLAVERELARVREEIERMEGRTRFLRSRVAVSTLTLTLHEPRPVIGAGANPIREAFRDAWRNFVGFTAGFISSLGVLIPLGLLVAACVWFVRRARWFRRPEVVRIRKDPPAE